MTFSSLPALVVVKMTTSNAASDEISWKWQYFCFSGVPEINKLKVSIARKAWWRHQMETFSALLAICAGNSPVPGEFLAQRPVTWSFDAFFDLHLNKRFSKQSCEASDLRWYCAHYDVTVMDKLVMTYVQYLSTVLDWHMQVLKDHTTRNHITTKHYFCLIWNWILVVFI